MQKLSKTQIDKLGERLKSGELYESDLRLLEEYRLTFSSAYEFVIGQLKNDFGLSPTGRLAKTTPSIIAKLRRESIRLTQIQDIAGCRVVVRDVEQQDELRNRIKGAFTVVHAVDRRDRPSHGYRAVHEVVKYENLLFEIQIRTLLQHLWAEFSEKLSDKTGTQLKYGLGDPVVLDLLNALSQGIEQLENMESKVLHFRTRLSGVLEKVKLTGQELIELNASEAVVIEQLQNARSRFEKLLRQAIEDLPEEDK